MTSRLPYQGPWAQDHEYNASVKPHGYRRLLDRRRNAKQHPMLAGGGRHRQ